MSVLTPPQLAARWGCTPETVLALIRRGALQAFTLSPATAKRPRWRITEEAVREFERLQGALPPGRSRSRRAATYREYV